MYFSVLCVSLGRYNPLCARECKRPGAIKPSFCASQFGRFSHHPHSHVRDKLLCSDQVLLFPVITGTVTSMMNGTRGALHLGVSVIKTYKAGQLVITQIGKAMSVKVVSRCRKCPMFRKGTSIVNTHSQPHSFLGLYFLQYADQSVLFFFLFFCARWELHYYGSSG